MKKKGGRHGRREADTVRDHSDVRDMKLRTHKRFIDIVCDKGYDRKGKRTDDDGSSSDVFGKVTKYNYFKNLRSTIHKYSTWAYEKYGDQALDFRNYKKKWADEYIKEQLDEKSVSTIHSYITRLNKFEEMLENQWFERTGKKRDFGIISNERVRNSLHEKGIYRDLEEMKKSLKLSSTPLFNKIEEELEKINPEYGKLWRFTGETGTRIDAALTTRADDVKPTHVHFANAKSGMRYDAKLIRPQYLKQLNDEYGDGPNRKLFQFKKQNGDELRIETVTRKFQVAVSTVGKKIGLNNLTPHSGRKYFSQNLYDGLDKKPEKEINKLISSNNEYKTAVAKELRNKKEKRLYNDKSYREAEKAGNPPPKQWQEWRKEFTRTGKLPSHLNYPISLTKEEKISCIVSVETGHQGRISILQYYLVRSVSRKNYGSK